MVFRGRNQRFLVPFVPLLLSHLLLRELLCVSSLALTNRYIDVHDTLLNANMSGFGGAGTLGGSSPFGGALASSTFAPGFGPSTPLKAADTSSPMEFKGMEPVTPDTAGLQVATRRMVKPKREEEPKTTGKRKEAEPTVSSLWTGTGLPTEEKKVEAEGPTRIRKTPASVFRVVGWTIAIGLLVYVLYASLSAEQKRYSQAYQSYGHAYMVLFLGIGSLIPLFLTAQYLLVNDEIEND